MSLLLFDAALHDDLTGPDHRPELAWPRRMAAEEPRIDYHQIQKNRYEYWVKKKK
jgi:hypothetical protein